MDTQDNQNQNPNQNQNFSYQAAPVPHRGGKKKWIIVLVIIILALWAVGSYNSFVRGGEQITAQWAQVENQYQRRFDLIPNIVSTVKGVAKQEQEVFGAIAEARTRYSGATTANAKAQAATQLEAGLGRLLVIAEQYPA